MEQLIIFTRYPQPGQTKTRLIPILGAEGAAQLHRQMTESTVTKAKKLQLLLPISLVIYFTGGNENLMGDWLGKDLIYQPQTKGDLGQRMSGAFAQAFASGMKRVVLIGVDCPCLSPQMLRDAFDSLSQADLVLGPAQDGGYYLIGLSFFVPQLFLGVDWGTSMVFSQTQAIAHSINLKVIHLLMLSDVDRPEDLGAWA